MFQHYIVSFDTRVKQKLSNGEGAYQPGRLCQLRTCADACPAFFELGSNDTLLRIAKAYRVDGKPEQGDAPPDLEECINEAAVLCPLQVMFVG